MKKLVVLIGIIIGINGCSSSTEISEQIDTSSKLYFFKSDANVEHW